MQIFGLDLRELLLIYLPELLFLVSFINLNVVLRKKEGTPIDKAGKIQFWARMLMASLAIEILDLLHWVLPVGVFRIVAVLAGIIVLFLMRSMVIVIQDRRRK